MKLQLSSIRTALLATVLINYLPFLRKVTIQTTQWGIVKPLTASPGPALWCGLHRNQVRDQTGTSPLPPAHFSLYSIGMTSPSADCSCSVHLNVAPLLLRSPFWF